MLGWEDLTDCDKSDFIFAMRREPQRPVIPPSTACVAISPVGEEARLFLGIPRINGSCDVDLETVGFYLNDETCTTAIPCGATPGINAVCRYPSPQDFLCEDDDVTGPCIDFSDVEAAVNVICAPDNAACNECINWETGSPTCTDYRTASGVRIKCCVLEDGSTCSWKKCCKKRRKTEACGF